MDESGSVEQGDELLMVARMFDDLGRQLRSAGTATAFDALTQVAVQRIPGTSAASITTLDRGHFITVSASDERARSADALQYEFGSGPCIDAILDRTLYAPGDLRQDDRWPDYGKRVHAEIGWTSMLSYRLAPELAARDVIAGLNLYGDEPHAFDDSSLRVGLLLATHGAMAVAAHINRDQLDHLERALDSNREIGVAIGVLMTRHRLTREQAFDLLRVASQHTNRKLHDIAVEVGDTGALPYDPRRS